MSRRDAILAKENPQARNCRSVTEARSSARGNLRLGNNFLKRARMLFAAVPLSCWCATACTSDWNGERRFSGLSEHFPCSRISFRKTESRFDKCLWAAGVIKLHQRFNDFLDFGNAFARFLRFQIQRRQQTDDLRSRWNHQNARRV